VDQALNRLCNTLLILNKRKSKQKARIIRRGMVESLPAGSASAPASRGACPEHGVRRRACPRACPREAGGMHRFPCCLGTCAIAKHGPGRGCNAGWLLIIFVSDLSSLAARINPTRDGCFNFFVGYGFKFLQLALGFIQLVFKLCQLSTISAHC
jgi:hypothetical protein